MGFAMLRKWMTDTSYSFAVVEPNDALRARVEAAGIGSYASADALPAGHKADVVVIATKPQTVGEVAERYSLVLKSGGLFISVAAGVGIQTIAERTGNEFAVIRSMPNTPAAIGEGMTVCYAGERVGASHRNLATELLSSIGKVAFVEDEKEMDAVTAVSGSGPAYLFHFIEALAVAANSAGLDEGLALQLAKQTIYGAAKLALDSIETPAALRQQVTSPNGTTAAALNVLMREDGGLFALLNEAVAAAKERSIQLREA